MSKSITHSLLALAVSSSLLVAQDAKAPSGWSAKPGSGLTYDGGDTFGLKWQTKLQVHWTFANNEDAPDTNSFNIRRARVDLSGHVFRREITYKFQLEAVDAGAGGDGAIKDGWVNWNFSTSDDAAVGLRVGQGKTQFGYEGTTSGFGLWFVERSSASRAFADARSRGAWLNGVLMKKEVPLRFAVGAMNTDVANGLGTGYTDRGEETANSDNELSYVLAANLDPLGDFHDGKQTVESRRQGDWRTENRDLKGTVGIGLALGNGVDTTTGADVESTSLNLNTAWNVSRFNLMGEWFTRTDDLQGGVNDEEEPMGWAASAGLLLDKNGDSAIQWGFGVRVSMIETDDGDNGAVNYVTGAQGIGGVEGDVTELGVVANAFYHGHACKTQFEWTLQDVDPDAGSSQTNHIFRVAFQLEF